MLPFCTHFPISTFTQETALDNYDLIWEHRSINYPYAYYFKRSNSPVYSLSVNLCILKQTEMSCANRFIQVSCSFIHMNEIYYRST